MKTPHELARAISALINSKPRSPTIEELEGVIGEHIAVDDGADTSSATGEWRWKPVTLKLDENTRHVWLGGDAPKPQPWAPSGDGVKLHSCGAMSGGPLVDVYRIEPGKLREALGKTPESPRARWAGPPSIEIEGGVLSIYYADPLCLMCPPDGKAVRTINGSLIHPNQLYVRWYDDEHDQVRLEPVPSWGAAKALSPHVYDALMTARLHERVQAAISAASVTGSDV
mgnify:CR=1 FL=1